MQQGTQGLLHQGIMDLLKLFSIFRPALRWRRRSHELLHSPEHLLSSLLLVVSRTANLTGAGRLIVAPVICDRVAGEFDRRLKGNEFRSNRHYISMNETIRKFRAKFGSVPIKTLKGTTLKAWLALEPLAVKTRNRHLSYIGNIFGIAREWELMDIDPFEKVESFNDPAKNGCKIGILTPEEFTKFLTALDPDWLPFFAISGFTGLRRSEIEKLDWSEFKLDRSLIDLPFHKSKNGNRKLIDVPENLVTILSPFVKHEGLIITPEKTSVR